MTGRGKNALRSRIHEVELALAIEDAGDAGVSPDASDGFADGGIERGMGVGVDLIIEEIVAVGPVAGDLRLQVELAHGADEILGAVDQVLVDGESIEGQLVDGVAILMDDLHLFDDGRFAALAGAWIGGAHDHGQHGLVDDGHRRRGDGRWRVSV